MQLLDRPTIRCLIGVCIVLLIAMALRAYRLGSDCFDCDELYAVRIRGVDPQSVAAVMARDGFHTNHPPLMTVPFLAWGEVFGHSEAAIRGLPVFAGVVAVAAVFFLGWVCGRPWAGLIGSALLAVNPLHITYSTEARQYALVTALVAIAHVLFVMALRRGTRGVVLAYYLIAAWASLTHYFAVPVLIGHAAAVLWLLRTAGPQRLPAFRLFLAVGLAGLPYLAWLPVMRFQSRGKWEHLAPFTPDAFINSLSELFAVGGWGSSAGLVLVIALVVVAVVGVWAARRATIPVSFSPRRLTPRWVSMVLVASGLGGGIGYALAFSRVIEPTARDTLLRYGYDATIVEQEVELLRQTGLLFAGCVVLAGAILYVAGRLEMRLIGRAEGQVASSRTNGPVCVNIGALLLIFLVVPVSVLSLGSLTGVPFHQTRNLLVMLPVVCIAWGFALEWLSSTRLGSIAAFVLVAGVLLSAGQYQVVGRFLGSDGPRLGMDTIDWREINGWLAIHAPAQTAVVVVDHPWTDPALHYLAQFKPIRMQPGEVPSNLPPRVVFIHLTGNNPGVEAIYALEAVRGPLEQAASGQGWELFVTSGSR